MEASKTRVSNETATGTTTEHGRVPLPVGMSWRFVAEKLGAPLRLLEREGVIVLSGEYFPEPGFALSEPDLNVSQVGREERARNHAYFLGELTASELGLRLADDSITPSRRPAVSPGTSLVALFTSREAAERARQKLLRASLVNGIQLEETSLGTELRVASAELPGRAGTTIAGLGGSLIAVGGTPLAERVVERRAPRSEF